jgi:hypothetical protein
LDLRGSIQVEISTTENQNPMAGDLTEERRKHVMLLAATLLLCVYKLLESTAPDKPNLAAIN